MASVAVTINGRRYEIACEEGQEAQLSRLGRYVDDRVRQLAAAVGQLGDTRLMVMTSLLLADELSDKNDELETYKVEHSVAVRERKDEMIVQKLDRLTQKITEIAQIMDDVDRVEVSSNVEAIVHNEDELDDPSAQ
ncbi:cell division protein ZapA [Terasakiella brassicae]|uniref:Cell division protein ZapA n=1 Tax=Terasakiella brassicae TaxID=1634917 RepID=A0A917BQ21_9PROT|nr:cell division protein ZapA [Terasakiella brassicae]GGF54548.1 cell division protein ZapA [Terasakiella brassicae]